MKTMRIYTLGTSHGNSTHSRFNSSTAYETNGVLYLVDAGAPVEALLRRKGLFCRDVRAVFVTHMHDDHAGGLSGLSKQVIKYPEGRIAVQVTPLKENFMARARVYFNYKDAADAYVSEATAYSERAFWAQSSAIGFALNYAGFGSQYSVFDSNEDEEPIDGFDGSLFDDETRDETLKAIEDTINASEQEQTDKEITSDEKYNKALAFMYPLAKYSGKTLGEVMEIDMAAINHLANGQTKNIAAKEAATCILENRVVA